MIGGLCFDKTASNTGRHSGTNVRLSQRQDSILLDLACRRHVYKLHIKHFWEKIITDKTAAPENLTNWNDTKDKIFPNW